MRRSAKSTWQAEALISEGLKRVLRGCTSSSITHWLSTVRDVDRILVWPDSFDRSFVNRIVDMDVQ